MRKANIEILTKEVVEIDGFRLYNALREIIYEELHLHPSCVYDESKKKITYTTAWRVEEFETTQEKIDIVNSFNTILDYLVRKHDIGINRL